MTGKRILLAMLTILTAIGPALAQTPPSQGQSSTRAQAASGAPKKPATKTADSKTEGMPAWPVLWIDRELVPPEHAESYTDVIHRTLNFYNSRHVEFRVLGLTSALPDTNEFFFLIQFHSFAELDDFERKFAQAPAEYQKTMQSLEAQEADLRKSREVIAAVFRPDLSYRADASAMAQARLIWVDQFIVTLGKMPEYESDVKFLIAANEKAGIDDHYFVYQSLAGAESQTIVVLHPMKALADWDHAAENAKKIDKVLDATGKKRMERLWKDQSPQGVGLSVERLYVLRPDLSLTSEKFASFDPDFWKPKKE